MRTISFSNYFGKYTTNYKKATTKVWLNGIVNIFYKFSNRNGWKLFTFYFRSKRKKSHDPFDSDSLALIEQPGVMNTVGTDYEYKNSFFIPKIPHFNEIDRSHSSVATPQAEKTSSEVAYTGLDSFSIQQSGAAIWSKLIHFIILNFITIITYNMFDNWYWCKLFNFFLKRPSGGT